MGEPELRRRLTLDVPARVCELARVRRIVGEAAAACGFEPADRYALVLATHEALVNAIEWGAPDAKGNVQVMVDLDPHGAQVAVFDHGMFVDAPAPPPNCERGRGLSLIRELADTASVDGRGDGTTVRFSRRSRGVA